jgi:hypothetical protein
MTPRIFCRKSNRGVVAYPSRIPITRLDGSVSTIEGTAATPSLS